MTRSTGARGAASARSGPSDAPVATLAARAARYTPADRAEKVRALEALRGCPVRSARSLLALHEALCFLQAYPDDANVLARVDEGLAELPARVAALGEAGRGRLDDSGIAGTRLDYPFGLPMARWLARRFPRETDVAWPRVDAERLEEALSLLVSRAEGDAFSEGGIGWQAWLAAARGTRPVTGLEALIELFDGAALAPETRDWVFESLELPIEWRPATLWGSRTGARLERSRPFFHTGGLRRSGIDLAREVLAPLRSIRRAPPPLAERLVETARLAMATRQRELYCFSYPNPDDVVVAEVERGLRVALIGLDRDHRLPLEGYYAFLALKNSVPVGYGGAWGFLGTLELGFNVFESFRQGESAFILSQVLRVYRHVTGIRTFSIDPYQLGDGNAEALRSGAFYFYYRQGFRPRAPEALRLAEQEDGKRATEPGYRSPLPVLARLARHHVYLTLPGGDPAPERRVRPARVAALVTRLVAREFGGDRRAAGRAAAARAARSLQVGSRAAWPRAERRAFDGLALVAALIPDLARWPARARAGMVALFRAKGGPTEERYFRLLARQPRLRATLAALVDDQVRFSRTEAPRTRPPQSAQK